MSFEILDVKLPVITNNDIPILDICHQVIKPYGTELEVLVASYFPASCILASPLRVPRNIFDPSSVEIRCHHDEYENF